MPVTFWKSARIEALPGIAHGITRRTGGISDAPGLESLNLSFRVGDDPAAVLENRQRAAAALGFGVGDMIFAEQVHGAEVVRVGHEDRGRGATGIAEAFPGVDALVTTDTGVLLTLLFADCYPILFADRLGRAAAVAHAGWRGAVGGVAEKTIAALQAAAEVGPEDIVAAIGPGIGACCFEVGEEVAAEFAGFTVAPPHGGTRPHVDLPAAIRARLIDAGVLRQNIDVCPDCTACAADRYFSHRRDHRRSGRIAGMIGRL